MNMIKHAFVGVSLVALTGWMAPALAQESSSQGSKPAAPAAQAAQAAQESTLKGELVRVDTTAKTISIRTEGATRADGVQLLGQREGVGRGREHHRDLVDDGQPGDRVLHQGVAKQPGRPHRSAEEVHVEAPQEAGAPGGA